MLCKYYNVSKNSPTVFVGTLLIWFEIPTKEKIIIVNSTFRDFKNMKIIFSYSAFSNLNLFKCVFLLYLSFLNMKLKEYFNVRAHSCLTRRVESDYFSWN